MSNPIESCRIHSDEKLSLLRESLSGLVPSKNIVLTCGSYARREASEHSDLDYFVITSSEVDLSNAVAASLEMPWLGEIKRAISQIVKVEPSNGGAFAKVEKFKSMVENIGGDHDTNHKITRRMLFLLEGEPLYNQDGLRILRRKILEKYINEKITDHQLALFLLNDIIRYYRTMATDYEFKINEDFKPWGIRNIKLVFSRKLLYASGLFSVAVTADRMRERKIRSLEHLFDLPVIDRMTEICGKEQMTGVLSSYSYFLEKFEKESIRNHLKVLKIEDRNDPVFRDLKNEGHHFTRELLKLFENKFDSTHPIRKAVVF